MAAGSQVHRGIRVEPSLFADSRISGEMNRGTARHPFVKGPGDL